jgi:hypothetical protein
MSNLPPTPAASIVLPGTATSLVKAKRTRKLTWKPQGNSLTSSAQFFFDPANNGTPFAIAIELEDAFDAVQIKFGSQATTDAYTVTGCVVASAPLRAAIISMSASLWSKQRSCAFSAFRPG